MAVVSSTVTVGATPTALNTVHYNWQTLYIVNGATNAITVGDSTLTTGIAVAASAAFPYALRVAPGDIVYAKTATTQPVAVLAIRE